VGKGFWKGDNEILEESFPAEASKKYLEDIATRHRESLTDKASEESLTAEALKKQVKVTAPRFKES
jgi:hypothetical protein